MEDLVVFMFCSALPKSYQDTTHQYLDNINNITKYKLQLTIDQVIQEESRRKAQNSTVSLLSTIHKFLTTKSYHKKCAKCGKNNHSTKDHWNKHPQKQTGGSGSRGGLLKKKDGGNRKKGGSSTKGKRPTAGQKQTMDGCINVL